MSSRTPTNHGAARSLPTERDLDRLAREIRTTAQERDLSERVAERYKDWIFLFVAWGLEAPPCRIRQDRIGEFWTALTQRQVGRGKVCQAMDALGFLFGTLGGPEALSFPTGSRLAKAPGASGTDEASDETGGPSTLVGDSPSVIQTNPDLRDLDPEPKTLHGGASIEDPSHYLPDGPLPGGVDARRAVPTQESRSDASDDPETPTSPEAPAGPEASEERPPDSRPSDSGPSDSEPSSGRSSRDTLTTLFNPEGTPPPENEDDPVEELFQKTGPSGEAPSRADASDNPHPSRTKSSGSSLEDDSSEAESAEETSPEEEIRPPTPLPNEARRLWDATDPEAEDSRHEPEGATGEPNAPEDEEKVSIEIPKAVADRVRKAARRLGLPPSVFAARGLDMICEDAGVERTDQAGFDSTLERYQAQLDLLHLGKQDLPDGPDAADNSTSESTSKEDHEAEGPPEPSSPGGGPPERGAEPDPAPDQDPAPGGDRQEWNLSDAGSRPESERPPEGAHPPEGNSLPKDGPAGGDGWIGDAPQFDD